MIIAVDFDGTIVEQEGRPYDDVVTPLRFMPGAREGLLALKNAGHVLILWSGRVSATIQPDPGASLVRAGIIGSGPRSALNQARYRQMVDFVTTHLSGVFAAIDDGRSGKPPAELFIDDRAMRLGAGGGAVSWPTLAEWYGEARTFPEPKPKMGYRAVSARWQALGARSIGMTGAGPILMLQTPLSKTRLTIIAGQHGEEPAGVLALYAHADEFLAAAKARGVALRIYPCANPEGFDRDQRNNWRGQEYTNTFMRYLIDGSWHGELSPGESFDDARLAEEMADETKLLLRDLEREPVPDGVLDLHQDSGLLAGEAFAFVFGRPGPYAKIMRESGAKPRAGWEFSTGSWSERPATLTTSKAGLVEFHDGSVTDYLWRRGAKMSICLETGFPDLERAMDANRDWVLGMIDAASRGTSARREDDELIRIVA